MKIIIPEWLTVLSDDGVPKNAAEINFHGKMTRIGDWAVENCKSLRKIFIPKSVKKIEVGAFDDCDLTIYAEAESKPEDWNLGWSNNLKIIFNAKRRDIEKP